MLTALATVRNLLCHVVGFIASWVDRNVGSLQCGVIAVWGHCSVGSLQSGSDRKVAEVKTLGKVSDSANDARLVGN